MAEDDKKPWMQFRLGKGYFYGSGHPRDGEPVDWPQPTSSETVEKREPLIVEVPTALSRVMTELDKQNEIDRRKAESQARKKAHQEKQKQEQAEKKKNRAEEDDSPLDPAYFALISRPYDPKSVNPNYPKEGDPNHCRLCRHRASHGPEDGCMDCTYTRDGGHVYCERHD